MSGKKKRRSRERLEWISCCEPGTDVRQMKSPPQPPLLQLQLRPRHRRHGRDFSEHLCWIFFSCPVNKTHSICHKAPPPPTLPLLPPRPLPFSHREPVYYFQFFFLSISFSQFNVGVEPGAEGEKWFLLFVIWNPAEEIISCFFTFSSARNTSQI